LVVSFAACHELVSDRARRVETDDSSVDCDPEFADATVVACAE
jgi:hypothetical protein